MIVRNFKISDLDDVLKIEFQSFSDPYPVGILIDLFNHGVGFLVAQVGKSVVGYVIFWVKNGVGHIIAIAVEENFRKMHIGSVLISNCIKIFKSNNIFSVTLEVRQSNIGAITFYRNKGFKEVRREIAYYSDGEDAIIMEYTIGN